MLKTVIIKGKQNRVFHLLWLTDVHTWTGANNVCGKNTEESAGEGD